MLRLIQDAAERITGKLPLPVITLAATDARYWRQRGVPAYIYGRSPDRMGTYDEAVDVEEFLNIVCVHALADTRAVADLLRRALAEGGLEPEVFAPHPEMPKIVAGSPAVPGPVGISCSNGHIDVFPVGAHGWTKDP